MGGSKSKNKGNSFERVIAKDLDGIYNFTKGFSRSAGSGAKFGGKNSVNLNINNRESSKAMLGDIQTPDGVNLIVECKSYKDLSFHQLLQGECKQVDKWLHQLNTDIETFRKVFGEILKGILVFKINSKGTYMMIQQQYIVPTKAVEMNNVGIYGEYYIISWDYVKDNPTLLNY